MLDSNLTLEEFLETIPCIDISGRSVPDASLPTHNQICYAFASSKVGSEFRKLRNNLAYESGGFESISGSWRSLADFFGQNETILAFVILRHAQVTKSGISQEHLHQLFFEKLWIRSRTSN